VDQAVSRVDIRLLGPVELMVRSGADGYRPVSLQSPRRRALLGLLALRTPGVVSVSALVDGVWRDRPPPSAGKTLRAHVAYLRRTLAAADLDGLIRTAPPGYALAADPDQVDIHRFEALSRRGRAALAAGAVDEAVELLAAALRLWRGDVLADCPVGEWARAEVARVEQARLDVLEELFAARIAKGGHVEAGAELETAVAQHPLRERLWELLMISLYRSGRQGDALGAYRRAREKLVAELGIEPGPALRRLEAAILRGDDELRAEAASLPAPAPPTPAKPAPTEPAPDLDGATLPVPITALVGRQREIAEVAALVAGRRLVTLTGTGGCGKTRLAVAVASHLADRYPAGVRFVDLTALTEPESLPATVAAALGAPQPVDIGQTDALQRHLRPMSLLLVLDNCEHLVGAVAELIESLLGHCPQLRVLTTSRETLGVLGEVAWPVPPLPIPPAPGDGGPALGMAAVREYDAVRLFLDRAAVPATRDLTDADGVALAAICAGLDGLPLAIELAAARTAVLTVPEIAERIHDPVLLRYRQAGSRPHHNALSSTMAWSYDLLDPTSQSRFRRLAVFAGGFTLAAARAVWSDTAEPALDSMGGLLAKSLVSMDRRPGGARYRLLETLRQYAGERLAAHPEEEATARRRHAAYYRSLCEEIDRELRGPKLGDLLDRLAVEHDNLRAALVWYGAHQPGLGGLRFASALARYCHLRGRYAEGRRWLQDALSHYDGPPVGELARALTEAARLAFLECDYAAAIRYGEEALGAYRRLADQRGTARLLRLLGSIARERGDYEGALARYADAVVAHRSTEDEAGVALTLQLSGFTRWLAGDLAGAEELLDQALAHHRRLADAEGIASTRVHLAAVAYYQERYARARWLADDAMVQFRKLDFDEGTAWALNIVGLLEHHDGAPGPAIAALRTSLRIHCTLGDRWRVASVLEALAAVLTSAGDPVTAAELLGAAATIRIEIGTPIPPQERTAWERTVKALSEALGERDRYEAYARGETLRLSDLPGRVASLVPPT